MAKDRHPLDNTEIGSLVAADIDSAVSYFTSHRAGNHERAIQYYRGDMPDLPSEVGRSQVVDHTVQDVIGWMLPGLMRVFFSADQIVVYEPKGPEDEAGAKQATDYVNNIVLTEAGAYQVFWDGFHDALLHRNGIIKHFWDPTPETRTVRKTGLNEVDYAQLVEADEAEVLEHTERVEMVAAPVGMDPFSGEPIIEEMPITVHDVKVKVEINKGTLRLMAVAPENFLIDENATCIDDARFYGERFMKTRSELREMGFDEDIIDKLPAGASIEAEGVAQARTERSDFNRTVGFDRSTEEVEVFEVYPLADVDGDGIAERLKVIWAGGPEPLDWEIWDDEGPYSDLVPERVPHRWAGRSVYDDTADIQRIKSVLMRQMLDNLYMSNIPDRYVNIEMIDNPDAVTERQIGNIIRGRGNATEAIQNLVIPFTAGASFQALEYMDQIVEKRTGVSRSSMGLDPETLQNQSATAANLQHAASYSKIELIARNFAEMGMKRIFRAILKLIVKHQDRARTVRLRNEWVEMDPSHWNADMDATVNVGLGSGSRDRDVQFLMAVLQEQKQVLGMVGGAATEYGQKIAKAINRTQAKLVEATGLKGADQFFPEITDEELAQIGQGSQQENPEVAKAKAQLELETQKSQAQMQMKQAEAEMDGQIRLQIAQQDAELRRYQIDAEMALKREQLSAELMLKRELGMVNAATKMNGATGGVHIGGEPG